MSLLLNTTDAARPNILLPTKAFICVNWTGRLAAMTPAQLRRVLNSLDCGSKESSRRGVNSLRGSRSPNLSRLSRGRYSLRSPSRGGYDLLRSSPPSRGSKVLREPVAGSRRNVLPKSLGVRSMCFRERIVGRGRRTECC